MNTCEKIKEFLRLKNAEIIRLTGEEYIGEDVIACCDSWPDDKCDRVWERLQYRITEGSEDGLEWTTCPSCIRWVPNCAKCEYGKAYGVCEDDNVSRWRKLNCRLSLLGSRDHHLPTNDFYRSIIEKINLEGEDENENNDNNKFNEGNPEIRPDSDVQTRPGVD